MAWRATVTGERETAKACRREGTAGPMEAAFPTEAKWVRAWKNEQDRCLSELGWCERVMRFGSTTYSFFSCDSLDVAVEELALAKDVQIEAEKVKSSKEGEVIRTCILDSDLYLQAQDEVRSIHGHSGRVFTMAVHIFSDIALLSFNGGMLPPPSWSLLSGLVFPVNETYPLPLFFRASLLQVLTLLPTCDARHAVCYYFLVPCTAHYVYPIRMRMPNVEKGKTQWLTVGYIPFVRPRHAPRTADKVRLRKVRDMLL